jgi:hypothetical protein
MRSGAFIAGLSHRISQSNRVRKQKSQCGIGLNSLPSTVRPVRGRKASFSLPLFLRLRSVCDVEKTYSNFHMTR